MRKITILLIFFMMVSAGFLTGCNEQSSGDIIIKSHDIRDSNLYYKSKEVYGKIENIGDENVDYAEITVKFYDNDNELLHTEKKQISYIANGQEKGFTITYCSSDPYYSQYDHYKISVWSRK